jgi:uncharacterized damage-inducible protein DinB
MTLTQILIEEAEVTYDLTEALFRKVDDQDLSWTPPAGHDWMSMGQLLMHCASFGCGKAVQGFVSGDWSIGEEDPGTQDHVPPAEALSCVDSVAQALALLAADRCLTRRFLEEAGEVNLLGRAVVAPWGGPAQPLFQHLLRMIAHLAQHKGQLFYYLKLMGRDVGTRDLWGT